LERGALESFQKERARERVEARLTGLREEAAHERLGRALLRGERRRDVLAR
jgi:hypothetical protein